jgi:hypothetical protein
VGDWPAMVTNMLSTMSIWKHAVLMVRHRLLRRTEERLLFLCSLGLNTTMWQLPGSPANFCLLNEKAGD